ncbi:hypothetical protein FRC08_004265 [Ceratobasidium sp. 394]|nr:hypothetical protein FRC08_004265 [Ceratobasidium sp. 394]
MPAEAPFESHIPPYSQIRVDHFTKTTYTPAWINLLSHIHSDHIQGLAASSFCSQIVCSEDSKRMLLLVESTDDRINYDRGLIPHKKRTFATLKSHGKNRRDLLLGIPLDTPTKLDIGPSEIATITLLDANHCPGAVMFLIEGRRGAVLHTGDIRAESSMVARLAKSPHLAPYLQGLRSQPSSKQLECIYLDTASMLGTQVVPSKAEAIDGLLELIDLYPQDVQFYINAWTWGYEDIFLGIKAHFNSKIHVDRYKYSVLCSLNNYTPSPSVTSESRPSFKDILTCDASTTRFHACERFNRCSAVKIEVPQSTKRKTHRASIIYNEPTRRVVYINPSAMAEDAWKTYVAEIAGQLRGGQFVDTLRVPLSRHSTLVELQSFVARLRPRNIFPNTLIPYLDGLDWACLPGIFADCLSLDGYETLRKSTLDGLRDRFPGIDLSQRGMELRAKQALRKIGRPDSDHDNAIGCTGDEWKEEQAGRLRRTQDHIKRFLPWLFGRQDAPPSEPGRGITPEVNLEQTPVSIAEPEELCATCAHCPTCGPRWQRDSSGAASTDQIIGSTLESSANTTSPSGTGANRAIFRQQIGQTNSPPLANTSLYTQYTKESPIRPSNDSIVERPNKKPRLERNRIVPHGSSSYTISPASLLTSRQTLNPAAPVAPRQRGKEPDRSPTLPRQQSSSYSHELSDDNPNAEQFDSSRTVPNRGTKTGATIPQSPAVQPDPVAPMREGCHNPSGNIQSPKPINPLLHTSPESSSRHSSVTRQSVPLDDSDRREQRRLSKLKERQIRNQLARLPPEFSQSLAATKSVTQTRPTIPDPNSGSTRNALVQRMQSGDLGPLDLDLGCVKSQSQGKGVS